MWREIHTIGELIDAYVKAAKGDDFADSQKIIRLWSHIVGDVVATHTVDIYYANGKVFVRVDSDALRNELTYSRSSIVKKLNEIAGRQLVKTLVIN